MKKTLYYNKTALEDLQKIIETYQEIASMRTRKTKNTVLQNRDYYSPLLETYQIVSSSYFMINHKAYKHETNGKSLALLLTTNTGLYGPINRDVFDLFVAKEVQIQTQSDLAVAGRLGKLWMEKAEFQKEYAYFDIEDDPNSEEAYIKKLFDYIVNYSEVRVYHGLFTSIVSQTAKTTELTKNLTSLSSEDQTLSFIFEPSIEKVLENFERQLLRSFFTQTLMESNLAKNGSRMMSLDKASQNIKASLERNKLQELLIKHQNQNKKQQEQATAFFFRGTI